MVAVYGTITVIAGRQGPVSVQIVGMSPRKKCQSRRRVDDRDDSLPVRLPIFWQYLRR